MKNKIHYSPESRRDLDDIWDYIVSELQNRSAAEHVVDRIMDAVDQLKNFAEMETLLSSIADVGTDYRFLVSGNYMVFYRVQDSDVHIDRVLYGRIDYMSALFKDLLREKQPNKIKIGKFYQKLADFSLCNYFFALSASSISLLKLSGFSISLGNS